LLLLFKIYKSIFTSCTLWSSDADAVLCYVCYIVGDWLLGNHELRPQKAQCLTYLLESAFGVNLHRVSCKGITEPSADKCPQCRNFDYCFHYLCDIFLLQSFLIHMFFVNWFFGVFDSLCIRKKYLNATYMHCWWISEEFGKQRIFIDWIYPFICFGVYNLIS